MAAQILANIDAMEIAFDHATGVVRTDRNWIGGNNVNPGSASFVGPLPQEVPRLLEDLSAGINDDILPPAGS